MPIALQGITLADEFAIATRLYYEAVVGMTRNHVPMSRTDYVRLREAAEEAGRRVEAMRIAFEEHIDSHHCVAQESRSPLS